jgi:adenylate kinase
MMVQKVKTVVLLGAPGAGKGTVAQYLVDNYGFVHFSTGNLLRNEVKKRSEVGVLVESLLGGGGLVGDDIVNRVVEINLLEYLTDDKTILLDGFPRSASQAQFLDSIASGALKDTLRVLEIDVDHDVVVQRISGRLLCANCGATFGAHDNVQKCSRCGGELVRRADDGEEVVRRRLREYVATTLPVSEYYADRLVKVPGNASPEDVMRSIDDTIRGFGF